MITFSQPEGVHITCNRVLLYLLKYMYSILYSVIQYFFFLANGGGGGPFLQVGHLFEDGC